MNPITIIFISVAVLFFILLAFKQIVRVRFCVLCAASLLTWVILLVLYYADRFDHLILIAVMIGESVVGLFYWIEKRVSQNLRLFRLPALLTLMFFGFALLGGPGRGSVLESLLALFIIWLAFGAFYLYRNNSLIVGVINKIVACCKDW